MFGIGQQARLSPLLGLQSRKRHPSVLVGEARPIDSPQSPTGGSDQFPRIGGWLGEGYDLAAVVLRLPWFERITVDRYRDHPRDVALGTQLLCCAWCDWPPIHCKTP